jgi:hypothetical protein
MREKEDAFVAAATVYFGTWSSIDDLELMGETPDDPESILIEKEELRAMPSECKTMIRIILDLPEEMFKAGGQVNLFGALKVVKNVTGWPMSKVLKTEATLRSLLTKGKSQKF